MYDEGIIAKVGTRQGLAEVAIDWFWQRHSTYIAHAKEFREKIEQPMMVLNRELDTLLGYDDTETTAQVEASLTVREGFMEEIGRAQGMDMPKAAEVLGTAPLVLEDEKGKPIPYTQTHYERGAQETIKEFGSIAAEVLAEKVAEEALQAQENTSTEGKQLHKRLTSAGGSQNKRLKSARRSSPSHASSSSSSSSSSSTPKRWKNVVEALNQAHLPPIGLPVRWDTTQGAHTKLAYDPKTKTTYNLDTDEETHHKKTPIGFIRSTKGRHPMPGTDQPDAARVALFEGAHFQENIVTDTEGRPLIPCLAHGDFVQVESLQADHLQAKERIIQRQKELVEKLNQDPAFAEVIMRQKGAGKFFVKVQMEQDKEPKYYGTVFFYELYFNDIDNLWLICQACNLHKSKEDALKWLEQQWTFGKEFLEYLDHEGFNDQGILAKVGDQQGLAEVAIGWFWQRHSTYIAHAKEFRENIEQPMMVLNRELDKLLGYDDTETTAQVEASLTVREGFMEEIGRAQGMDMPKAAEVLGTAPLVVEDDKGKAIPYTQDHYERGAQETIKEFGAIAAELLAEKVAEEALHEQESTTADLQSKDNRYG